MRFFCFAKTLCLLTSCAVALGACSPSYFYEGRPLPALTFAHLEPVKLSVGEVEIESLYDRKKKDPFDLAGFFPTPPDEAVLRYFQSRFKPAGDNGLVKLVIEDASVKHSYIEADNIIMKWGRVGGMDRYDLALDLVLYIDEGPGEGRLTKRIDIERYVTVPESFSVSQREERQLQFTEQLIKDIDALLMTELRPYMSDAPE